MESLIITGVNASGELKGKPQLATEIREVHIDVPINELGDTGPYVTLSGATTGAYSFYNDQKMNLRFGYNEDIYVTTNLSGNYSAIINYVRAGDQKASFHNTSSSIPRNTPTFWRYR